MKEKKQANGIAKIDVYKVDRSPETIRKAKEMFKDIEHIHAPYSAVQMLKIARGQKI